VGTSNLAGLLFIFRLKLEIKLTISSVIGRIGRHSLPGRSSDLGSLGCRLWGWMKAMIFYGVKAGTRDALLGRNVDTQTKSGPPSGG